MKNRNRHAQVLTDTPTRECRDCFEDIPTTDTAFYWETSDDEQFWLSSQKTQGPLCEACWVRRDNYEPPEPDGEAFRGGEAAAYEAEQMDAARRLK